LGNRQAQATDLLVIGSGIAGCAAALAAARRGLDVTLLTKETEAQETNTLYAQGGIIYEGQHDSPQLLAHDIVEAGAGLTLPAAAQLLAEEGPRLVREILIDELKVPFDTAEAPEERSGFHLTAEAAHSLPRILHYKDMTGWAIERALIEAVSRHPRIRLLVNHTAVDLLTLSHHSRRTLDVYGPPTCVGAYLLDQASGRIEPMLARETVLATGGLGRLFLHTTNPPGSRGDGIAMAARAGVRIINLQFVQFHPTALLHWSGRFLLSEALRGEGAKLIDSRGNEFMRDFHADGSLAPRDVVARGIHQMMLDTGEPSAFLDISHKPADWVKSHFPSIYSKCKKLGFDLTREPIPVVPAAHYSCGGVAVDEWGRSSMHRLRAVGEVSCTGVHGANRLASTSLLEGLVWGTRAGSSAADAIGASRDDYYFPSINPWQYENEPVDPALIAQDWLTIQHTTWNYIGLARTEKRLQRAQKILTELQTEVEDFYRRGEMSDALIGLRNGLIAALTMLGAAIEARVSVGCHFRADDANGRRRVARKR
jgi:L-aspartate oxidase